MFNFEGGRSEFLENEPFEYSPSPEVINEEEDNLGEMIRLEKNEVKEKFADMVDYVGRRYESPDSTLSQSEEQLKAFKEHNEQILDKCIEQGIKRGLNEDELAKLEVSAILHDLSKGDTPPKWAAGIGNFTLVYHGESAAEEIGSNEKLQQLLKDELGEDDLEDKVAHIQRAIRSHMGPHPGFMSDVLGMVNEELKEKGLDQIEHSRPKEGDQVAEVLLAADMYSLASSKGIRKVMAIRSAVPFFKQQDKDLSTEYAEIGIELNPGEAAILSAFDSAYAARDMIQNNDDKEWIQSTIDKSVESKYRYNPLDDGDRRISGHVPEGCDRRQTGIMVSIEEAQQKRKQFEDAKKSREALEKIQEIV